MEALFLIPTLILAFLLWQEKKDRSEAEAAWRLERVGLLDRIQAPDQIVVQPNFEPNELRHVPFDDDERYWEAVNDDGRS